MSDRTTDTSKSETLRSRAEAILDGYLQDPATPTAGEVARLVHELEVHRIELEMQNEALLETQRELELSRDRYASLYDFAPLGYVTLDPHGLIQEINLTAASIIRKDRRRLLGTPFSAFLPPADRAVFRAHLGECAEGAAVCEVRLSDGAGGVTPVQLRSVEVGTSIIEESPAIRTAITDISERKRAEETLRSVVEGTARASGTELLRVLAKHLAQALGVRFTIIGELVDSEPPGVRTHAVWTGKEFEANFDYPLSGSPCEGTAVGMVAAHGSGLGQRFPTFPLVTRGAESYLGAPLLDAAGRQLGVLAVLDDRPMAPDPAVAHAVVTIFAARAAGEIERRRAAEERERLEERVRQAQKLESLGVLAGGVAHDFNNILVAILGNADLALLESHLPPPVGKSLEAIKTASLRASELANQMLAYSGRGCIVVKSLDLNELVSEMHRLLLVTIRKTSDLRLELDDDLPAVRGDAAQLRQVVLNLITNAHEAIAERGTITVSTGVIEASKEYLAESFVDDALPAGPYVFLDVTDSGCGIPEEARPRLFDPFYSTKFAGRGLGLAVLLGIVRGHHGAIRVGSAVGRGSVFRVLLPVAAEAPAAETPVNHESKPLDWTATGRVLIVDDEEFVRDTLRAMLESDGLTVMTAPDGPAGIDLYRDHADEIAVVLLDMTMPGLSGETVLQELRRIREGVRVVVSSGYSEEEITARIGDDNAVRFLQKPFHAGALLAALSDAVAED